MWASSPCTSGCYKTDQEMLPPSRATRWPSALYEPSTSAISATLLLCILKYLEDTRLSVIRANMERMFYRCHHGSWSQCAVAFLVDAATTCTAVLAATRAREGTSGMCSPPWLVEEACNLHSAARNYWNSIQTRSLQDTLHLMNIEFACLMCILPHYEVLQKTFEWERWTIT